jgi:hypothetical protein
MEITIFTHFKCKARLDLPFVANVLSVSKYNHLVTLSGLQPQ